MPKQKTKKSILKRFRITKKGKVLRGQSFGRHLSVTKNRKRKRRLSKTVLTKPSYAKRVKKVLGK